MKLIIENISKCNICSNKLKKVASLPDYPLTEFFSNKRQIKKKFNINQKLLFCETCKHISLEKIVNQSFLYSNYKVKSKTSIKHAGEYLTNFYLFIKKNSKNFGKKAIIDIGGNDSTFLNLFKNKLKINIDPNASGKKDIIKEKEYFEEVNFSKYNDLKKIYVSSHTIEHIPNIKSLIKKISLSMKINDYFFLQYPSLEMFVNNSRFDQITHQHLNLYSLKSISRVLNKNNLFILKYEFDNSVFGTVRLKIIKSSKKNNFDVRISSREIKRKFSNFKNFYKIINKVLEFEKNLIGFGAGIMVPTLNYYLPVINKLKFILDNDLSKNNKFFINMKPKIKHFNGNFKLLKNHKILITSISTENTLKVICKKLIENKLSFFIPSYKI